MPDNTSTGMLETFLSSLVPSSGRRLWRCAQVTVRCAKLLRAPFNSAHLRKAQVHTFLAWQEPPGQRFGIAITGRALDAHATYAEALVHWFQQVYELDPLP